MQLRLVALFPLLAIAACATPPPWGDGCDCEPSSLPEPTKPSVGAPAKGTPAPEEPRIVIDSKDECIEKVYWRTEIAVSKLDPARRLIVQNVEGRTESATLFDADRRVIASAYWGADGTTSQQDYTFDANRHVTEYRTSKVDWAPLFTSAKSGDYELLRYENAYGENGALVRSFKTRVIRGLPDRQFTYEYLFEENAAEQCAQIELRLHFGSSNAFPDGKTSVRIEKRTYDEAGRLSRSDVFGIDDVTGTELMSSTIWTYDVQGRLVQTRWWRDGTKLDDPPGATTTITFGADGSQHIVSVNNTSDTGDFGPFVTERSAYCAVIDAWKSSDANGKPKPLRCAAL